MGLCLNVYEDHIGTDQFKPSVKDYLEENEQSLKQSKTQVEKSISGLENQIDKLTKIAEKESIKNKKKIMDLN